MQQPNLLDTRNGRFLTFGLLYISEGVPYGFTSVAMVTFMRQHGLGGLGGGEGGQRGWADRTGRAPRA